MQAIRARYFGPTNARDSRIQAKCEAKTITVPYNHSLSIEGNHAAACSALLANLDWVGDHYSAMVGGQFDNDYYWVFSSDLSPVAK